jgi:hypothetical protein
MYISSKHVSEMSENLEIYEPLEYMDFSLKFCLCVIM